MSQKTVIRTSIIVLGLVTVTMIVALVFANDPNPAARLHAAAAELHSKPTEDQLQHLLNIDCDGEHSYLKLALVGKAFTEEPELFRSIASFPSTPLEQHCIDRLAQLGPLVFEHHEALKPPNFEAAFRNATWLKSDASQPGSANDR